MREGESLFSGSSSPNEVSLLFFSPAVQLRVGLRGGCDRWQDASRYYLWRVRPSPHCEVPITRVHGLPPSHGPSRLPLPLRPASQASAWDLRKGGAGSSHLPVPSSRSRQRGHCLNDRRAFKRMKERHFGAVRCSASAPVSLNAASAFSTSRAPHFPAETRRVGGDP